MVEINSETDFAAKNERFRELVRSVAQTALQSDLPVKTGSNEISLDALAAQAMPSGASASDAVAEVAGGVRENIKLRRGFRIGSEAGLISSYVHTSPAPGLGRMAALVALETSTASLTEDQQSEAKEVGQKVAMHAVAMKPRYLSPDTVPAEALEAEKQVLRDQAKSAGSGGKPKPANIIEKIISGRINKFYEDSCLVRQKFVMADDQSVQDYVKTAGKQLGIDLRIGSFARVQVGEGLEKSDKDFAAEVAETLKSTV
ncbi:TPA: Elongation factor, variant 4 [Trebouxia sp. C0004]